MLLTVARFELRYPLRNPLLWLTALVTFAIYFIGISAGVELGNEGGCSRMPCSRRSSITS